MTQSVDLLIIHTHSSQVVQWMRSGKALDWHQSPGVAFPKVTMCDFNVRRLGNLHRYTVQCTLPINMYNEKIYMFLWFWMLFVAIMSFISLITWLLRALMSVNRIRYVKNHLLSAGRIYEMPYDQEFQRELRQDIRKFVRSYLRSDGVFILHLIGHNTNHLTVTEIVAALWDKRPDYCRTGLKGRELAPLHEKPPL